MSQIKEPFFNGEWIHNIYPITPPLSVYFRISKCGKYRQYQLRYNDSIMNGISFLFLMIKIIGIWKKYL